MSASNIPYHLRQNKAIDRNLFAETLLRLNRHFDIQQYTYVSFGGPFLEDFKLIHASTGISKMISIESNPNVIPRQTFNKPLDCIDCLHKKSKEFLEDYDFDAKHIIWLDYAIARELGEQLAETEFLITQLNLGAVVRITVNASADTLGDMNKVLLDNSKRELKECSDRLAGKTVIPAKPKQLNEYRFENLKRRAGSYIPYASTDKEMQSLKYPSLLCRMIKLAIQKGMSSKPGLYFQPLTAFTYADSKQRMLTYCGIILSDEKEEIERFFEATGFDLWRHANIEGESATEIAVPALSIRERIAIDRLLPNDDLAKIKSSLGFLIDDDDELSDAGLANYVTYYRHYPYFSRIAI